MKQKFFLTNFFLLIGFCVVAQTISIDQKNYKQGLVYNFIVRGSGTQFSKGVNTLKFLKNGIATNKITVDSGYYIWDDDQIKGIIRIDKGAELGNYDFQIANTVNNVILCL